MLTTESWTPSVLMAWEPIRAINTFVNYRTPKQPQSKPATPDRQSWDKTRRSGFILFYLFYLNDLIFENPWNSAQHVASAVEVFAVVVISAVTSTGAERTCPVTQRVKGLGPFQGILPPWGGLHRTFFFFFFHPLTDTLLLI